MILIIVLNNTNRNVFIVSSFYSRNSRNTAFLMPSIGNDSKEFGEIIKQINVSSVPVRRNGFNIIGYVVKMLNTGNSVRPRNVTRSLWNDTNGTSLFNIRDSEFRVKIPTKTENTTSDPKTLKGHMKGFIEQVEQYFLNSTLHGLRYIGDASISFGERLFWFLSFCGAICFATYFINSIYEKYNLNPIIMSLNPTPTPLSTLPFPAITVCSMNQAKKSEAEQILATGSEVERMLLDDYCNANNSFTNTTNVSDEATKWDNVMKFILKVSPTCQDILKVCIWRQQDMDCQFVFNSILTDEGLCCTFNALPRLNIFRNPSELSDLNLTYPGKVDDWSPERGYGPSVTDNTVPWKAAGAGTHLGLTLVLDSAINTYYCSSTSSYGFKLLLHNPIETPKMADFAFLVAPGIESRIVILPKIFDATQSLRSIDYIKRMCFFSNERRLQFYRTYTERNCKLECQANYTLQLCSCVPFYLPSKYLNSHKANLRKTITESKQTKICGKKDEACSIIAKDTMESPQKNKTTCNCLPGCFEVGYDGVGTQSIIGQTFKISENIIKEEPISYFVRNMAILHFYFVDSVFTRNTKSEIYSFSEFLSNTGGLLSLFMGFSFLSIVEVGYYLTLKLMCTLVRKQRNKTKRDRSKNTIVVYPFSK